MGKRNTSRRLAMQVLYQADLVGIEIETALGNVLDTGEFIEETLDFARLLARGAWESRAELDQIISDFAIDWPLDRIGKVDRSVLRLALYELKTAGTPASVIINEAVEIAKKYSGEEAAKFINGILGAYVRKKAE